MNEELRQAGLDAVCQIKTGNWSDAREFLRALGKTNSRQQEYPPSSSSSPPSSHSSCSSWAGRLTTPDLKDNGEKKAKQTHQENDEFLKGSGVSVEGASGWVGRGVGSDQQQRKNTDYMQDASAVRAAERGDGDGDRGNDDEDGYCREGGVMSVVKPARGCASGSVFLCRGEREAEEAFRKILGAPKYGTPGAVNEEVGFLFLRKDEGMYFFFGFSHLFFRSICRPCIGDGSFTCTVFRFFGLSCFSLLCFSIHDSLSSWYVDVHVLCKVHVFLPLEKLLEYGVKTPF